MPKCGCRNNRSNCQICYPVTQYVVPVRECNSSAGSGSGGTGATGPRGPTGPQGVQGPPGAAGAGQVISVILDENGNYRITVDGTPVGVPIPGPTAP